MYPRKKVSRSNQVNRLGKRSGCVQCGCNVGNPLGESTYYRAENLLSIDGEELIQGTDCVARPCLIRLWSILSSGLVARLCINDAASYQLCPLFR